MENLINDNLDSSSSGESDNETKKHSKKSDMNLIVISLLKIEVVFNNEKSLIMCVIMLYQTFIFASLKILASSKKIKITSYLFFR